MKKKNKAHQVPSVTPYTIIEITNRYCSDKIQPNVKVGNRYMVVKIETLRDSNIPVLIVKNISSMTSKKTIRVNAERFTWKKISAVELINEQKVKQATDDVKQAVNVLNGKFSSEEQKHILLIPSAILEIALYYARGTYELCKGDKKKGIDGLSSYRKLSRELTTLLDEMDKNASISLGDNYKKLQNDVKRLIENNSMQFFCFKNVVNMEFKRIDTKSEDRVLDIQTNAVCALYFLAMFERHELEVDEMIEKKIGEKPRHNISQEVIALRKILAKYALVNTLGFTENQNIRIGFQGIKNAIDKMKFNIHEIEV